MERKDPSFEDFVRRQWGPLTRVAFLLTGDRHEAEDLVQVALEKTHRRWSRIERIDAPEVYVRRALVNTASSWRRRRRVAEVPLAVHDTTRVADAYPEVDGRQDMLRALRELPAKTRAVLVLRYFEDLSETEIATVLGCAPGSVKSLASRGLAQLRDGSHPAARRFTKLVTEEMA